MGLGLGDPGEPRAAGGGPGGAVGGDPALLPVRAAWVPSSEREGLVLPHRTVSPRCALQPGGVGAPGPGGARRGHDRAAGEGARSPRRPVRGEASRSSAAEPRPLHGGQSPGSLYHGSLTVAPVSRPRALTKPQDQSVASRGRGAAEAVGSPAFQGRADAEGTPGLGVLTGPLQTPPWRASLPPPPPGSWVQHPQPLGGALPRA